MTKLTAGPAGFDMEFGLDFSSYPDATPTTANSGKVIFTADGFDVLVKGSGFTYGGPGEFPADGTINSVRVTQGGLPVVAITKASLDVSDMRTAIATNHPELIAAALFGGDDKLIGGHDGANVLMGFTGNDQIVGGLADDTLDGGAGNDTIIGGRGRDAMVGGADADVFVFGNTMESRRSAPDIIFDITDQDTIDVRAIDANIGKTGNQAFTLVDAFSHKAGEITLTYDAVTKYTTVSFDVDGDARADMVILLDGSQFGDVDHSGFTNFIL